MFLTWQTGTMTMPEFGSTIFLYDPETNTDLVTGTVCGVLRTGTTVDSAVLIDGHKTIKNATSTHGVAITFPKPIDLGSLPEWTIEWSTRPTSVGYDYGTEMLLNWPSGPFVGARWTDGGFGYRLQFSGGDGFGNAATVWRIPQTNTTIINKLNKFAMVLKDGKISVYLNGVKQTMNNGTSNAVAQDYFAKLGAWQPLTVMNIGWTNGTYVGWLGNYGRIRISKGARYTANYTPDPF